MTSPQSDQIIAIVAKAIGRQRWLRPSPPVTTDSQLIEDLGCDSLDIVDIAVAVEEALGVDITDAAIDGWCTVGDVIASVSALREVA